VSRVCVKCVVEGYSERDLVKYLLAPHLREMGIDISASVVITRRNKKKGQVHKGGGRSIQHYLNDLKNSYHQWGKQDNVWFSSMIDVYGLPKDFPERENGYKNSNHQNKVECLENALHESAEAIGIRKDRFIPYLALHEFETLCALQRMDM